MPSMSWNEYYLNMANTARQKSKDPSTKVGAIIVGKDHEIISTGFNGFPRGIDELDQSRWERPIKYEFVVHAEANAILNAARQGIRTAGTTLYVVGMGPPTAPCTGCAKSIIQAGITTVVGGAYKAVTPTWGADFDFSLALLKEAGVEFVEYSSWL